MHFSWALSSLVSVVSRRPDGLGVLTRNCKLSRPYESGRAHTIRPDRCKLGLRAAIHETAKNWHGCCFELNRRIAEGSSTDDSSRIRAAPEAATHSNPETATVREIVAAVGAGMCARTE